MKYILPFLLLSLYCTAQNYDNYVKITAVRIVDPDREGHTLITGFIKDDAYLGNRLQALQDDDEQLAFALLNLKKEARQWDKRLLPNNNGRDTPLKVPNMYVVQINRHRDTIFTTHNNASIYFPDEQMDRSIIVGCKYSITMTVYLYYIHVRNFKWCVPTVIVGQ